MRVLRVLDVTFGVTPEIEAAWPVVVEAARAGGTDTVHFRTSDGGSGSLPLDDRVPIEFLDVEDPESGRHLGDIVSVLRGDDDEGIGRELDAMSPPLDDFDELDIEGMPEEERLARLAALHASAPGVDHERLAAGALAGRATPDRPNTPPWEFDRWAEEHPDVTLDDLARVRFPEVYAERRGFTVTSFDDLLKGPFPPGAEVPTIAEEIARWRYLHERGVVRWDADRRAVVRTVGFGAHRAALREWFVSRRAR
jgi:hypothetical protein